MNFLKYLPLLLLLIYSCQSDEEEYPFIGRWKGERKGTSYLYQSDGDSTKVSERLPSDIKIRLKPDGTGKLDDYEIVWYFNEKINELYITFDTSDSEIGEENSYNFSRWKIVTNNKDYQMWESVNYSYHYMTHEPLAVSYEIIELD